MASGYDQANAVIQAVLKNAGLPILWINGLKGIDKMGSRHVFFLVYSVESRAAFLTGTCNNTSEGDFAAGGKKEDVLHIGSYQFGYPF